MQVIEHESFKDSVGNYFLIPNLNLSLIILFGLIFYFGLKFPNNYFKKFYRTSFYAKILFLSLFCHFFFVQSLYSSTLSTNRVLVKSDNILNTKEQGLLLFKAHFRFISNNLYYFLKSIE